jgi:hypothetical protein
MTDLAESRWNRLEIVCATLTGYFREDSINDCLLVPTISEMPCIVMELVDRAGNREAVGLFFGDVLDGARRDAARLAADFGVTVVDCTLTAARRGQQ